MLSIFIWSPIIFAFISALALVPVLRNIAVQNQWVDSPDGNRKKHTGSIPNIGGIAIAVSFGVGLLGFLIFGDLVEFKFNKSTVLLISGALFIVVTGFLDDIYGVGFKKKLLVQGVVAYLVLHAGYRVEVSNVPFIEVDAYQQALYSIPLTFLWVVGILNAINFIDGLDGLAAGISAIAFCFIALLSGIQGNIIILSMSLLMIGALVGFLVYNYSPASIFMGDSGSLFIGYMLAICTLSLGDGAHVNPFLALLIPVIVLGLPVLDTGLCIIRRVAAGRSPFAADHDHLHHRLSALMSRSNAVIVLYGIAFWFGVIAFLISLVDVAVGFGIVMATGCIVLLSLHLLNHFEVNSDLKKVQIKTDVQRANSNEANEAGISIATSPRKELHPYSFSDLVSHDHKNELATEHRHTLRNES